MKGLFLFVLLACTAPPPQGCVTCHGYRTVFWGGQDHGVYAVDACMACHEPAEFYYVWNRGYLGADVSPAEFWLRHGRGR